MTTRLSQSVLSSVADLVGARFGLDFRNRGRDLEWGIRAAVREQGHSNIDDYVQKLLSGNPGCRELDLLVTHLTVGETYFFRDKSALEILEKRIVPELLQTRPSGNELRIWSAGCATGEEPYSIAMIVDRMEARLRSQKIKISATDVNIHALQKASEGIYGEWSFRDAPPWVKSTYFQEAPDGRWTILPTIKSRVSFSRFNLVDNSCPSWLEGENAVDVIFCRNVLMYFTPEALREVVHRFHRSLTPNGWLIVSPAETSPDFFSQFGAINLGGATLYRKSPAPAHVPLPDTWCSEAADFPWAEPTLTGLQSKISDHGPADKTIGKIKLDRCERPAPSIAQARQGPGPMLHRARSYANQGRLAEAISCCEQAIAADKMAATAHYLKATILQEQGLLEEALLCLRQSVYVHPHFILGHFALGNLALKHGRVKESRKHFENVWLLLAQCQADDIVPESDGLSAGMLREMLPGRDLLTPQRAGPQPEEATR